MPIYYINNRKNDGNNEVHTSDCHRLKLAVDTTRLGWFTDAKDAVRYAKAKGWSDADGCYYCSSEAHHG